MEAQVPTNSIALLLLLVIISHLTEKNTDDVMEEHVRPRFPITGYIIIGLFLFFLVLGGCFKQTVHDGPPTRHVDISKIKEPVPHYLPKSRYGNPASYVIHGKRYHVLKSAKNYDKRGIASWYGTKFHGKLTSTREHYDMFAMTAASPELPIPCFVRVTNLENGKQIIVKVNDRGPFAPNRIIDLSYTAAKKLGYERKGTAMVEVTTIDVENPLHKTITHLAHKQPQLYLQVGAFSHLDNAEQLKLQLQEITQQQIKIAHSPGHRLYKVQIGPLKGVGESDHVQTAIAKAGLGEAITIIG